MSTESVLRLSVLKYWNTALVSRLVPGLVPALMLVLVLAIRASHTHRVRKEDLPASLLKLDVGLLPLVGLEVHAGLEAVHLEGLVDAALSVQV